MLGIEAGKGKRGRFYIWARIEAAPERLIEKGEGMKNFLLAVSIWGLVFCNASFAQEAINDSVKNEPPPSAEMKAETSLVSLIEGLHREIDKNRPDHSIKSGEPRDSEFDASDYFKYFKHISPPEGQLLDYAYCGDLVGGRPVLYWRDTTSQPLKDCGQFRSFAYSESDLNDLSSHLVLDGSEESFYEFLVFNLLAGQFYLDWHANYNDTRIVDSNEVIEAIIKEINEGDFGSPFDEKQVTAARALEVMPSVDLTDEKVAIVSVVTFSKWGGFEKLTKTISRSSPHIISGENKEKLLEYYCGVMF